jgi:PhzF family phenazine biosynthesis protein
MKYFVVDAFTDRLFGGNPAGVCLLDEWRDDVLLQDIAAENNLAETAFVVKRDNYYELRWFTPVMEVDLCGHATLASAFVVTNFLDKGKEQMDFHTKSGILSVKKFDDFFEMDFPSRMPVKVEVASQMEQALGISVLEAHISRDLLLLLETEDQVISLQPSFEQIAKLPDCLGVIATAKGDSADFVSRFFAPKVGVPEDPVTGSAHSTLIPFWSERLGKEKMVAKQVSKRGGTLYCENCGDRVKISGKAVLYLSGEIAVQ